MADQGEGSALTEAVLSGHVLAQMARRQVSPADVRAVLSNPEEVLPVRRGRVVAQRVVAFPPGRPYLVRVFVDVDREPPEVVTAYRTSRIDKYRSTP